MASALTDKLSRLVKEMRGQARITEANVQDMLREVRMALLEADVALPVVRDFIARVKDKALGAEVMGSLQPGQVLVSIVSKELAATMGEGVSDINLAAQPPAVILMAGLQGAGKTTTTAKLAKHLIEKRKKKVLTVSGDVYRPAAIEQLKTVTAQAGAEWFPSTPDQKPVDIARAAIDYAKRHFFDVLLVDTAGRLAIDEALMAEIKELHAVLNPVETLFVVDAMQGQDAVNTAKAFKDALPLTGIILTKLDGDSRGGAALSVRQITGAPIKFAGTSEKLDGLEVFDAERHAGRILGMGDIVALVEQVTAGVDVAAAQKLAAKLKSGSGFDLDDFLSQLQQMKNMGGLASLMGSEQGSPTYVPALIADKTAGLVLVNAVLAALLHRERTGEGQYVEVPMFEALVEFNLAEHLGGLAFEPPMGGAGYARIVSGGRRPLRTADGHVTILPYNPAQWIKLFRRLGRDDILVRYPIGDRHELNVNVRQLYAELAHEGPKRTTDQWMEICGQLDLPATPIYSLDDLPNHPHLKAVGMFQVMAHPSEGAVRYVRPAVRFMASPASVRLPAPRLGEDTASVLAGLGYAGADIAALQAAGVIMTQAAGNNVAREP